jgi:CRISPR-associated protein Csb2
VIALRIEFLAGRFHANPWDRGTNDGDVEWPPSPWRLLRALAAGWYRAGEADRSAFVSVLDGLSEAPAYLLPRATTAHTRHYMPLGATKNGTLEKTLVLDSFISLEKGREGIATAYAIWPHAGLTPQQHRILDRCCTYVGYLGRAESWCAIGVTDAVPNSSALEVVDLASRGNGEGPVVRRLGVGASLRGDGLLAALSLTTAQMRSSRRLMPVGAVWLDYRLPPDFLMVQEQYNRPERSRPVFGPTVLRFALERGEHSPKPSIKDAVVLSELMRAAAIKQFSKREGEPTPYRLAGKSEDGSKREGHDHPYFLPFDSEGRGDIDGIDVWFPDGCTHAEYVAVTTVTQLCERVIYNDDFPVTFVGRVQRPRASAWHSSTPIILERFPKIRGTNGGRRIVDPPEEQIAEMIWRTFERPVRIEVWRPGRGIERTHGGHLRIDSFRRSRIRKPTAPAPLAAATLHFNEPVQGPIVLGRLAHFGLGRFEPIEREVL